MENRYSEVIGSVVIVVVAILTIWLCSLCHAATWGEAKPKRYPEIARWEIARLEEAIRADVDPVLVAIAKELLPRLRFYWKNRLNDRNGDGVVNLLDVAVIMRGYGADARPRQSINTSGGNNPTPIINTAPDVNEQLQVIRDMNDPSMLKQAMEFLESVK